MKSSFNVLIEKDEAGYSAYCPEIEGYKVRAKSLDVVVDNLKSAILAYLEETSAQAGENNNRAIWEIAQEIIQDMTEEEIQQFCKEYL
jgi:predicted RNase H-like HicB family nuclease